MVGCIFASRFCEYILWHAGSIGYIFLLSRDYFLEGNFLFSQKYFLVFSRKVYATHFPPFLWRIEKEMKTTSSMENINDQTKKRPVVAQAIQNNWACTQN